MPTSGRVGRDPGSPEGGAPPCRRSSTHITTRHRGLELVEFRHDYVRHGPRAPLVRNRRIVEAADLVVAFWHGESHGTKYTIDYAEERGVDVHTVRYGGQCA